jgi:hypothetical protein
MASTIKVDNVQNQPGTNVVNKCGTTVNIGAASDNIRSAGNNLQASDGGNLISQSGTDITLGASGDTINLASGASQSGFGRTGTVDWVTTPKVTGDSPVTGATGSGYFLNTTAGTITLNLPAGAAGSIVSMADYAATWQTNNVTVTPNGSEKIGGVNASVTLSTEGQSVTLIYIDSTQGWLNTMDSTSNVRGAAFITATGGTPCAGQTSGDYKYHTFTGPGTFCVSSLATSSANNAVDYLVVAGGGSGAQNSGGGGGAGGYRESPGTATGCYTVSPLGAAPAVAITVTASPYSIVVGGGGAGATVPAVGGNNGSDSSFSTITSTGGGLGGFNPPSAPCTSPGSPGGSGGGARRDNDGPDPATDTGQGNTPPFTPAQGMPGGISPATPGSWMGGGGGGGALTAGGDGTSGGSAPTEVGGPGGGGATSSINATPTARAGGGAGSIGGANGTRGTGGAGGGGAGQAGPPAPAVNGTDNLGGGGGGSESGTSGNGGGGTVILRYKFQ